MESLIKSLDRAKLQGAITTVLSLAQGYTASGDRALLLPKSKRDVLNYVATILAQLEEEVVQNQPN